MKKCSKCGVEKEGEEFGFQGKGRRLRAQCRTCHSITNREWHRRNHPETSPKQPAQRFVCRKCGQQTKRGGGRTPTNTGLCLACWEHERCPLGNGKCQKCGSNEVYRRALCLDCCLPVLCNDLKTRRQRFREAGLCKNCGSELDVPGRKACSGCLDKFRSAGKRAHLALKRRCFELLGGCFCRCCGEDEIDFLSVDHVNNDGGKHRREHGWRAGGMHLYRRLLKREFSADGLQVLCLNCQMSKRISGICKHQLKADKPFVFVA